MRPEKVSLVRPGLGTLDGILVSRVFQGTSWLFVVDTPAGTILACDLHRGAPPFAEKEPVALTWQAKDATLIPGGAGHG